MEGQSQNLVAYRLARDSRCPVVTISICAGDIPMGADVQVLKKGCHTLHQNRQAHARCFKTPQYAL